MNIVQVTLMAVLTTALLGINTGREDSSANAAGVSLDDVLVDASLPSITDVFNNDFPVKITYSETPFEAFLSLSGGAVTADLDSNMSVDFKLDGAYWDWKISVGSARAGVLFEEWDMLFLEVVAQHVVNPHPHDDTPEGQKASFNGSINADFDFSQGGFYSRGSHVPREHPQEDGESTHYDLYTFLLFGSGFDGAFENEIESWGFSATADHVGAVPVPASLPLFLSGLAGLGFFGWRRKRLAA